MNDLDEVARRIVGEARSISLENPTGEKGRGALATLETGSAARPLAILESAGR